MEQRKVGVAGRTAQSCGHMSERERLKLSEILHGHSL